MDFVTTVKIVELGIGFVRGKKCFLIRNVLLN